MSEGLSAAEYLHGLSGSLARDALVLDSLFREVTGHDPVLWGPSVVGYGQSDPITHPASAAEGFEIGFSVREERLFIYLRRYADHYAELLDTLGGMECGKACLSITSLDDVDKDALRELIEFAWNDRSRAE